MPLDRYRAKRDFARTPEPAGAAGDAPESAANGALGAGADASQGPLGLPHADGGLRFVIQKHAATRLHYDFRLELDGVLLSWAVPKGPSLDPRDKRFAARVEDHPLEYGDFEGTIPKGEYGGGTVMLWDRGTWEPEGDPHAGLARGDLKFTLHGVKLKGSWVLVRMHKRSAEEGKENWLLIKHRDSHAVEGDGDALLAEQSRSVLTGRTLEEIAGEAGARHAGTAPAVQDAHARTTPGRPAEMPAHIRPHLATPVKAAPEGDDWLHEVKFDGYRTIARVEDGSVDLHSRNDLDWTDRYAPIAQELAALSVRSAVLDGEVIVQRPDGTSDFGALQEDLGAGRTERLRYAVFDLLYLDGRDLTGLPLGQRKALLASLLAGRPPGARVFYVDDVRGQGPAFFAQACATGLEGVVSKRTDSVYRPGTRGRDWVKTTCLRRQEFVAVGYTPPAAGRTGFGALLLGARDAAGTLRYAGRVGTGFSARFLEEFGHTLRAIEVPLPSVALGAERAPADAVWVRPAYVAEVAFADVTASGQLRHPSFKGLREDKTPAVVVFEPTAHEPEQAAGNGRTTGAPDDQTAGGPHDIDDPSPVTLTNPDRVFWPLTGTTKRELVEYYEWVAPHMLPHVIDRPISMVRCPHGVDAPGAPVRHPGAASCFFHKHAGADFPGPFGRIEILESKGPASYLTITGAGSLIALAQMGVLEIHTWGARWPDIEHPDIVVFDLDPGDDVGWRQLADAARLVRDVLDGLGLTSFVKTTGGKGLHVCAPIVPGYDWDGVKRFARQVAEGIAAYAPDRYTATMVKARRDGRVFIDYLRNGRTATFIAPFSTRARGRPTVAVPLRWDELGGRIRPDTHDIESMRRRMAHLGGDPWEGYFELTQTITPEMMGELGLGGGV